MEQWIIPAGRLTFFLLFLAVLTGLLNRQIKKIFPKVKTLTLHKTFGILAALAALFHLYTIFF
ncbi:MAG: hypothetical protein KBH12_02645 [Synergistaceae bacterium]|nr:hypothetical protein [Synergistaceae bacterium]MBP9626198.1 hypothetical protein [Synergistaceae bacterium]MBP9957074.1 hypothetical protein [Synergistaceae bacterium]